MISDRLTYSINPAQLQDWIREKLKHTSQNGLAKDMGISRTALAQVLEGRDKIKGTTLKAFASYQEKKPDQLLKELEGEVVSEHSTPEVILPSSVVQIPVYDMSEAIDPEGSLSRIIQYVAFDKAVMNKYSDNLAALQMVGDSMVNTINPGDLVIVNLDNKLSTDGVYLIEMEGQLLIKRVSRMPGNTVEVTSDNRKYPSFSVSLKDEILRVLGRVVMQFQQL